MKDKEVIEAINWRKSILKRKFCKHNLQYYEIKDNKSKILLPEEYRYLICSKCGEYRGKVFLEYEGMYFK